MMSSKSAIEPLVSRESVSFPDFGPCNIKDWKRFLKDSEEKFLSRCANRIVYKETPSDFDQIAFLGRGTFGDVILVKHKEDGKFMAMKAISKEKIIKRKQLAHVKNEKMILYSIDFPLAVYLLFCFKDNSYIYFVMPFIPGGDLFKHLKIIQYFNETHAKFYICQVVLAIEYLHYLDLVYRDLKPENILIDHTGYLKLSDFGFCKRLINSRTYTLCGTPEYLAPEVIMNKGYGKSVDWWTVGVLIYELCYGFPPFHSKDPMKMYEKITALNYKMPRFFSNELQDLIRNILQSDLSKRYGNMKNGVEDIKCHKWFKTMKWMSILNRKIAAPYKPKYIEPKNAGTKLVTLSVSSTNLYADEFADF